MIDVDERALLSFLWVFVLLNVRSPVELASQVRRSPEGKFEPL